MSWLLQTLCNIVQWGCVAAWSFIWMTVAIIYGLLQPKSAKTTLSWARNYWSPGLARIAQATIIKHPGFTPKPEDPYIFIMNHQSMFDIVAAMSLTPVNLRFIAKKVIQSVPFLGWYMTVAGMVFIDRRNREAAVRSLEEACQKIRNGASILVYPEGTRSTDGKILPFKKGPFIMAIQAGVPIVPIVIDKSHIVLGRNSLTMRKATVHFKIGEPIPTAGFTMAQRDELMKKVRDTIIDLHVSIGGAGGDKSLTISAEGKEGE